MPFVSFISWLLTIAGVALALFSIVLAFLPLRPPLLRFGPSATVFVYLTAALIHYRIEGIAPFLLIPTGCFGLFLGLRFLSLRTVLAYSFAGLSFVFWPSVIFAFTRYLVLKSFHS